MANWRDHLRPASFRGVPFEVLSRNGATGRRGPDHEYPDRDEGFPEDTGKSIRRYTVPAVLLASRLGGDYVPAKNKLLEALEKKGPGEYIDPWGDAWQVQVRTATWVESVEEGGTVRFQIAFTEYNPKAAHTVAADTAHAVREAGDSGKAALVKDFKSKIDTHGNGNIVSRALDAADALLDKVEAALFEINNLTRDNETINRVSSLLVRVRSLRESLLSLVSSSGYGASVSALLTLVMGAHQEGWQRYDAARSFLNFGEDFTPIAPTTPTLAQAADNQTAMVELVRGLAAMEAAQASADIAFAVYDDAVAVRREVAASLEVQMMTASDPVYACLDTLRAASVRDITTRGADLSRLSDVVTPADIPALALAHRLYGDASRDSDVLARNPVIRHPGFIPGGLILKVPTDD